MDERWVVAVKYPNARLGFLGLGTCVHLSEAWAYDSEAQAAQAAHNRFWSASLDMPVFKPMKYEDALVLVTTQEIRHG